MDIVRLLLEYKADNNLQDINGHTALIWALENKCLDVVKLLKNIHRNQISKGFKLTQTQNFMYIPTDIFNFIGEFTY